MQNYELVIFDCDGVLVDSERITNRIFCSMLNDLGLNVTLRDMFEHFVGHSMEQCIQIMTDMLGKAPPDTFLPELWQRCQEALASEVTPMAGVEAVLAELDIPYCVASSGDHAKIRLTLGTTGLLEQFEGRIFSVVDVERPKPFPDVFLLAASTHRVAPSRCVVIEDTPTGVRAGVAAGMKVCGFAANTPRHRLEEAGAHIVFDDMGELLGVLGKG